MLSCELYINKTIENQSLLNHSSLFSFFKEFVMMSSLKGSPIETEGMNSLMDLVCLLPRMIGMVDRLDPCLNDLGISISEIQNHWFEQLLFFKRRT